MRDGEKLHAAGMRRAASDADSRMLCCHFYAHDASPPLTPDGNAPRLFRCDYAADDYILIGCCRADMICYAHSRFFKCCSLALARAMPAALKKISCACRCDIRRGGRDSAIGTQPSAGGLCFLRLAAYSRTRETDMMIGVICFNVYCWPPQEKKSRALIAANCSRRRCDERQGAGTR